MINLIPKQEKRKMKIDFYYRLATLFFIIIGFGFLIGSVSLLPAYFFENAKAVTINTKLTSGSRVVVPAIDKETEANINDINTKLARIEKAEANPYLPSVKVMNAVLLKKRSDISINKISYETTPKEKKINVEGTAPSREVLLLFRQALEDDSMFKTVNLPISNFVKGSNIKFSMTLTPA